MRYSTIASRFNILFSFSGKELTSLLDVSLAGQQSSKFLSVENHSLRKRAVKRDLACRNHTKSKRQKLLNTEQKFLQEI